MEEFKDSYIIDPIADNIMSLFTSIFSELDKADIDYSTYKIKASTKPESKDTVTCINVEITDTKLLTKELTEGSYLYVDVQLDKNNNPVKFIATTELNLNSLTSTQNQNNIQEPLICTVSTKHYNNYEMLEALKSVIKYSKKLLSDNQFRDNILNNKNSASYKQKGKEKKALNDRVVA
jgi:hypothetical protein